MRHLGTFRAAYLVALSCIGSFLFAYDTGIVGGVLTLPSFQKDMGITAETETNVSSLSASLLQAGGERFPGMVDRLMFIFAQRFSRASSSGPSPHATGAVCRLCSQP